MARELDVYLYGQPAATLSLVGSSTYRLDYLPEWVNADVSVPISLSLPLSSRRHTGRAVSDFLDNLLPDCQGVRDEWARRAGMPSAEIFGLLEVHGADVAGALEFYPAGKSPRVSNSFESLSEDNIAMRIRLIREDDTQWVGSDATAGQFSLGGAQGKFALARHNGTWREPAGSHPSTHIFKPAVHRTDDGEIVEFVTMTAAALLGLPTALVDLVAFGSEHSLVVNRFDRFVAEGPDVHRIHQEDLSQALGVPRIRKYEMHGGPGYRDILKLLDRLPDREASRAAKDRFVKSLVFSWLVLNTDGHSKNYSLQLLPGRTDLAPLYDVSSFIPFAKPREAGAAALTEAFAATTLSMKPVGSYLAGDVGHFEWWGVAKEAGLPSDSLLEWARELCVNAPSVFDAVIATLEPRYRTAVIDRLQERLPIRARQAQAALTAR